MIAFGLIIYNVRTTTTENAITQTDYLSLQSSKYLEEVLNKDVAILKTLANVFHNFNELPEQERLILQDDIFRNVMKETEQFASVGISWEIYSLDSTYHKPYGRYRYTYFWKDGRITLKVDTMNVDGDDINSLYREIKIAKKELITRAYYDSYTDLEEDKLLMSSIAIPVVKNNRFEGLVVGDITLSRFNKMISDIKPIKETKTFLLTNEGNFVAFYNDKFITKSVKSIYKEENEEYEILENVRRGKPVSFLRTDSLGQEHYTTLKPIDIGEFGTPWSFGISVPLEVIQSQSRRLVIISIILGFVGLFFIGIVIWFIAHQITKPLFQATEILKQLSEGNISEKLKIEKIGKDEIGEIGQSLNLLIEGLISTANFAKNIGEGKLDSKFEVLGKNDVLGTSLLEMRKSLKIAQIEEKKRKQDEEIQSWVIQGETKFAEILRENNQDIETLAYEVISNLVKYTGANQGGLFVINDDDKENVIIELAASYAYDRQKILSKKITPGVGLVGRAVMESETIYMTDVPNDYVNITSGLGERNPQSILIVPLKFNEVIYAVVELASFKEFKAYVRKFVEKIGVSIASTIGTVKISVQSAKLVKELTVQSQELAAQEEEMRQNMEEMQATQEETSKQIFELESYVQAINEISYVAEYSVEGKLTDINDNYLQLIGMTREEMLGKMQGSFSTEKDRRRKHFEIWNKIKSGQTVKNEQTVVINKKKIILQEVYAPIYNEYGDIIKVLNIATDTQKE